MCLVLVGYCQSNVRHDYSTNKIKTVGINFIESKCLYFYIFFKIFRYL